MLDCPACQRRFPEVVGAPSQVCPHCGHEWSGDAAPAATPAVRLPSDPVGAIAHAWRIVKRDHFLLLLLWIPATIAELGFAFAIAGYERVARIPGAGEMTTGESMQYLGVALPLGIVLVTIRLALWAFIARRALDAPLPARALVGPALLAGFMLTLTYAAGVLLLLVGFLVFVHWFLYVPAMLAQGAPSVSAAFEASRRFARERRTHGFTALVLLLGGAFFLPSSLAGLVPGSTGIVLVALVGLVTGPILPLLAASFVAVAAASPPAGEGPAAPARATTRCPRCGTLLPHEPSATPIHVVCPSCGHSGRVL